MARPDAGSGHQTPATAILTVVSAVSLFCFSDVLAKLLSRDVSSLQISWLRYAVFSAVATTLVLRAGRGALRPTRLGLQVLRGVLLLGSATLFILGLGRLGVAEATAVSFVTPAFITALSIPLLGEVVHLRRWLALAIGLLGVLVVLRPGADAFQAAALFPLGSALCGALMVIVTRRIGAADRPETTMFWSALVGMVALSLTAPWWFRPVSWTQAAEGAAMGMFYAAGQHLLILAYSRAPASVLAPFSYVQLMIATALGYAVFNAVPDGLSLAGMALILLGGVYTLYREGVLSRGGPGLWRDRRTNRL